MIRVCIITEFEQKEFFQWYVALKHFSDVDVSSVLMTPETLHNYSSDSLFWNPIREADVVFVYCVRHNMSWKWYELPFIVRKWMKPKAKMICQFDLEFLWLWHPQHFPWKEIDQWSNGKTPKEFFNETKVLEVADAYIVFFNSHLKKFISKPVYEIPLPQLVRYEVFLNRVKNSFEDKNGNVVILKHSVKSASYEHTLKNVIQKLKLPVTIFTCEHTGSTQKKEMFKTLQNGSRVYGRISRDAYVDLLERGFIAIDDNEGYYGWSRFAMECALTYVPCVGSTLAVKKFFPKLYTKYKDYKTQRKLIKKLCSDRKFWIKMAKAGKRNVLRMMDTACLVNKFTEMIKSTKIQRTVSKRINSKSSILKNTAKEYKLYMEFVMNHFPKSIPRRPNSDERIYDGIFKQILDCEMWDGFYSKWKPFIDGKTLEEVQLEEEGKSIDKIYKEPSNKRELRPLEKFTIIIFISRCGESLKRCIDSIIVQNPDEVRAYVDTIKIHGKKLKKVCDLLDEYNIKVFTQALTSDSDKRKCRRLQKRAINKLIKTGGEKYKFDVEDFSIHYSAHPDCVRNVHRAILESENKWVAFVDDDDEWGEANIKNILSKYTDSNVGIICGDRLYYDDNHVIFENGTKIIYPRDVNRIKTPTVIINRDAFRQIHQNISHKAWQDFRRMYWIMRAGYKTVYVPKIFGKIHSNKFRDPRRIVQGSGKTWKKIVKELDKIMLL